MPGFPKVKAPQGLRMTAACQDPLALGAWSQPTPVYGNANPLQCCCLGHPLDRGAWRATVHGFTKSQTCLSDQTTDNSWSLARGGSWIMCSEKAHILVVKVGGVGGTPKTRLSVPSYEQMLPMLSEEDSLGTGLVGHSRLVPLRIPGPLRLERVLRSDEMGPSIHSFFIHLPVGIEYP